MCPSSGAIRLTAHNPRNITVYDTDETEIPMDDGGSIGIGGKEPEHGKSGFAFGSRSLRMLKYLQSNEAWKDDDPYFVVIRGEPSVEGVIAYLRRESAEMRMYSNRYGKGGVALKRPGEAAPHWIKEPESVPSGSMFHP